MTRSLRPHALPSAVRPAFSNRSRFQLARLPGAGALLLGCPVSGSQSPRPGELLAPPPEGQGIQLEMRTEIEPGEEVEHCKFIQMPASGLNVNRTETRFTSGSHHVLLYRTQYTSIPTQKQDGTQVDTSDVFDCSDGATNGWDVLDVIGGSQNAEGGTFSEFPDNVAMRVEPNTVLMINAHYINTTQKPIEPLVKINLETIPDSQVEHEGGILFYYNIFIRANGMAKSQARMRCAVPNDITLLNAQSHMHARGVDYSAEILQEGKEAQPLYQNDRWENVPVKTWDSGLAIQGGSQIDYRCHYDNPEERTAWQGPRTTDEMCMFIGAYYPATPGASFCSYDLDNGIDTQQIGAKWIGNGTKTCAESLLCLQTSASKGLEGVTDCVADVKEEDSVMFSNALGCVFANSGSTSACQTEIDTCLGK
ncbi:MAG: hypothetical protein KC492_45345 [Myxococcales bacterium]|nr:hypothetical protein [Myxococcales bacterium]